MAKSDHVFTCQACGAIWAKWTGKCEACGEWNTLVEEAARPVVPGALAAPVGGKKSKALAFVDLAADAEPPARLATGISEFDRVCGGGLVPASAILVGGDPGVGKSTLLLQAAAALARNGQSVAYVTGEEAEAQVQEVSSTTRGRDGSSQNPRRLEAAEARRRDRGFDPDGVGGRR
jgi:DNA repair protein RadA/Sms